MNNLEHEGIDEEDVFYAELRRQILILTSDEDEVNLDSKQSHSVPSVKLGSKSSSCSVAQPGGYFIWGENQNSDLAPNWLANLWRNNGTGVFIPHIVKSRTRHRPGRMNNERRRMFKQVDNKN